MTTDVIGRLRSADPCPVPVAYDDSVAQRNIDTIVRTDLTVGGDPTPVRRPHPRAWLAVAAAVVVLGVGGSLIGVEISRDAAPVVRAGESSPAPLPFSPSGSVAAVPWTTFSGHDVTFEYSTEWTSYPTGGVTTMSAPVAYLSTTAFPPLCVTSTSVEGNEMTECHPPDPDLGQGGVLVDWTDDFLPALASLDRYSGTATTIGGLDARIDETTLPEECAPTGAVKGVLAAIATGRGSVLTMTACIGPGDVDADLAAVDRMLASVQISR